MEPGRWGRPGRGGRRTMDIALVNVADLLRFGEG
jgi:hypothetical protein